MRSTFALGFLALAGFSAAQDSVQYDYPYQIDPDSVADSDKRAWCQNQKAQCPLICLQQPDVTTMTTNANDCDWEALTYQCICANGVSPNITQYSQTLPYYICTAWGNQCVDNCGQNNNACANDCRADHPCGAQSPNPPNSSLLATMTKTADSSKASKTADIPLTGFGGAQQTGDADSNNNGGGEGAASSMLNLGQGYGLAVVFAGLFAGFAIVL